MEEKIVESAFRPGCQQSEVADIVDVAVWDLMAQTFNKFRHRITGLDSTLGFEILGQKPDLIRADFQDPILGDGRTPHVPTGISQDLPLTPHPSAVHVPPPLVLGIQQPVELLAFWETA